MTSIREPVYTSSCISTHMEDIGMKKKENVKTTVDLPEKLWKAAKIRAMEERSDLRSIIMKALEMYLKKGGSQ